MQKNHDNQCTLVIESLSGYHEEKKFSDKMSLLIDYNSFVNDLQKQKDNISEEEVYVFKTPETTLVAYKNVFDSIELVTTELFYRRFYLDKKKIKRVRSLTGE